MARADDEEWVAEAAIPLASLGVAPKAGTRVLVDLSRYDTPRKTKERRCSAFGTPGAGPRHTLLGAALRTDAVSLRTDAVPLRIDTRTASFPLVFPLVPLTIGCP